MDGMLQLYDSVDQEHTVQKARENMYVYMHVCANTSRLTLLCNYRPHDCLSVCPQGGVCLSACWYTTPLGAGTPGPDPSGTRHPPGTRPLPPIPHPPPPYQQRATVADGTHPTGMHSCSKKDLRN